MKEEYYIVFGIVLSVAIFILKNRNDEKTKNIDFKKALREKSKRLRNKFLNSADVNHPISKSIIRLLDFYHLYENVGKTLTDEEIKKVEARLKLELPKSYKIFLKYFGDGGYWIFVQAIDSIQKGGFYKEYDYHNQLSEYVYLNNEKIKTNSLLCLMTEDSNGGAWCWLTNYQIKDNEWPLAYYIDGKLHYKVKNFTEWLSVVASEQEVIRKYDVEEKLGLG